VQEQQQQQHWVCNTGNSSTGHWRTKQAFQKAVLQTSRHKQLITHSIIKRMLQHHLYQGRKPTACTCSTLQQQHQTLHVAQLRAGQVASLKPRSR
jgi:hypothetical protein